MKVTKNVVLTIICALSALTTANAEEEKEIALIDAPAEVQQVVEGFLGLLPDGAKLTELIEETEEQALVFEAEIEVPGSVEYEVEISAQGKILEIELEDEDDEDED